MKNNKCRKLRVIVKGAPDPRLAGLVLPILQRMTRFQKPVEARARDGKADGAKKRT